MRVSKWEDDSQSNLYSYVVNSLGRRRTGWAPNYEKTFTPQTFSYFSPNLPLDQVEIWISNSIVLNNILGRHRIDDL